MRNFVFGRPGRLFSTGGAVAVALAGFAVSPPAFAAERPLVVLVSPDIVTRVITYADLNLASAPGEAALNRRVDSAVSNLCSEITGGDNLGFPRNLKDHYCRTSSWGQARPQIDRAVRRARDIVLTGASTGIAPIAASAITITLPK